MLAAKPHFAVFISPQAPGSTADSIIFANGEAYKDYVRMKQPRELAVDGGAVWRILGDSAYANRIEPDLHFIALPKSNSRSSYTEEEKESLKATRVAVERFFGRLKTLWKVRVIIIWSFITVNILLFYLGSSSIRPR